MLLIHHVARKRVWEQSLGFIFPFFGGGSLRVFALEKQNDKFIEEIYKNSIEINIFKMIHHRLLCEGTPQPDSSLLHQDHSQLLELGLPEVNQLGSL